HLTIREIRPPCPLRFAQNLPQNPCRHVANQVFVVHENRVVAAVVDEPPATTGHSRLRVRRWAVRRWNWTLASYGRLWRFVRTIEHPGNPKRDLIGDDLQVS